MVEVQAVQRIDEISDLEYRQLLSLVSEEKRERIQRFRRREDALRTLIGDILIRRLVIKRTGLKNSGIYFGTNEYGKPYIEGAESLHFNISHSGDWVVLAVSNFEVGVDVERIKETQVDIAKRFFSRDEYSQILSKMEEEQRSFFFDLWTLKESYMKAWGKGMSIPLDSFTIRVGERGIHAEVKEEIAPCYFRQYGLHQEYKLSVCAFEDVFCDQVKVEYAHELYADFIHDAKK